MSTRLPPPPPSTLLPTSRPLISSMSSISSTSRPLSLNSVSRPSPWDAIDLATVEIVDLTDTSPHGTTRRRASSPSQERPSKKAKGKQPETYITLDDEDDEESEDDEGSQPVPGLRLQSPSQSGFLSDVKCVICLDSPTDLTSTPCGHVFCDFCIRSALKAGTNPQRGRGGTITFTGACPICRRRVTTRNLIPLEIKVRS